MTDRNTPSIDESAFRTTILDHARGLAQLVLVFAGLVLFVGTAAAQSPGEAFCNTAMAQTIQTIFTLIQFGGPLLGGVLALGATVALPFVRRSDWNKEMKGIRNQGLLWGVILAPLGTQIVAFILNNAVAGGTSWGF
ncbi:MAG: hypothetical protein V5A24_05765 [Haloarculaceae archaeon]